jgi:hypothetical protein
MYRYKILENINIIDLELKNVNVVNKKRNE